MRADGAEPQAVTVRSGREPFQSADGLRLYYIWDDQIWVKNLRDGSESRVEALAGYKIDRYWAIGRTDLYFLAPEDDGDSQLLALNLQSNQIRRVHEVSGSRVPYVSGLSVSADDRWLVISLIDKSFSNISVASNW
jgi:tricorn protease-like protein